MRLLISLPLMLLCFSLAGCAAPEKGCGAFSIQGDLQVIKKGNQNPAFCRINYKYTNTSTQEVSPIIATRLLDGQGNTLTEDTIRFNQIDPGKQQEKLGGFVNCGVKVLEVTGTSSRPDGVTICGVRSNRFSFN